MNEYNNPSLKTLLRTKDCSTYSLLHAQQDALTQYKGCEMLRVPHSLENQLIDGGKTVGPTHPPHFTPQKHYYFYVSGTHFC
jgi:hypothetical protein